MFSRDSAFANVDESQLEPTISSWKRRARLAVRGADLPCKHPLDNSEITGQSFKQQLYLST
jgi:hypothetical protein